MVSIHSYLFPILGEDTKKNVFTCISFSSVWYQINVFLSCVFLSCILFLHAILNIRNFHGLQKVTSIGITNINYMNCNFFLLCNQKNFHRILEFFYSYNTYHVSHIILMLCLVMCWYVFRISQPREARRFH